MMSVPPGQRQQLTDDGEVPGALYASPAVNDGEVKLFVVLSMHPRKIIHVTIPVEFMDDEVGPEIEALAEKIRERHGMNKQWGPRLVG